MMATEEALSRAVKRSSTATRLMLVFAGLMGVAMFLPTARFVVYLFPALAVAVSIYLVRVNRVAYVEFVSWLYMLTPLVRRVVDSKTGSPETTLMLAPYLATAVCLIPLISHWREILGARITPYVFLAGTILYGCVITLVHLMVLGFIQGIFAWLVPLAFALFIYLERKRLHGLYAGFERVMLYGTLILGAYGIVQYFLLPSWDRVWMEVSEIVTIGPAEPLEVRVFSTMNAPQVLGAYIVVGILVAFRSRHRIKILALPVGILTLALSMSRSAWLAMVAGILYLCWRLPSRERTRLIIAVVCAGVTFIGALQVGPIGETLAPRLASLTDVKNDESAGARTNTYATVLESLMKSPFGLGVGAESDASNGISDDMHDSSIINMLFSFGALGSLTFCYGVLVLVVPILVGEAHGSQSDLIALQAATVALVVEAFVNNILTGPNSFLTWLVLGLGYASLQGSREPRLLPQRAASFTESPAGGMS